MKLPFSFLKQSMIQDPLKKLISKGRSHQKAAKFKEKGKNRVNFLVPSHYKETMIQK